MTNNIDYKDKESKEYQWAKALCECAGENESFLNQFWNKLINSPKVYEEFSFYLKNGQFLGKNSIAGMTIIDIMIWQMDHFKSDLDRGLYDMQSNPDVMLLRAFETMLEMEQRPEAYLQKYSNDTGTDYPGKI